MRPDKRRRIAQETLEIYAPIANRLGLYKVFRTLQDISFSLIHPWRAQAITRAVDAACGDRRDFFAQIEEAIAQKMQSEGIEAAVFGREKGLYSIYLKMQRKLKAKESRPFRRIYDLYGFRVIVHEERDCYLALGALHALYKPREGRFKDYIANEKSNGYRSLHTTLTGPGGTPLEIQVRTEEMDHVAQTGIASHLLYKDGGSDEELRLKTHKWLQSLLEMQDEDAVEFFENVKIDLFPDEVYVFTPQGEIKALPQGATPIDMAYAIHTDVGNHCQAARINHEAASLRMELQNGDVVEIITSPEASPDPSWIAYARTGWARNRIRHCLKKSHPDDCAALGKKLLSRELKSLGLALSEISEPAWQQILKASGNRAPDEVYIDIALGKRLAAVVARRLLALAGLPAKQSVRSLSIRGTEGSAVHLASCCLPVPGEPVIGSIKKAQGVVVHARDCPAAAKMQGGQGKWIDVEWAAGADEFFNTRIAVEAEAGKKQQDLLVAELAVAISEAGANINDLSRALDAEKGRVHLSFIVQVHSLSHLQKLLATLGQKPGVQSAARAYALPS
jgi:RelA/SpoT family (p)ppGpp synthetase